MNQDNIDTNNPPDYHIINTNPSTSSLPSYQYVLNDPRYVSLPSYQSIYPQVQIDYQNDNDQYNYNQYIVAIEL